jgi:hypothetical protein
MSEDKPRATKKYLRSIQNAKAHLTEMLQQDTKPIFKRAGSSPLPGEVPIGTRFRNLVAVPVTEEDRVERRRFLRYLEEEEKRVIAELEAKNKGPKTKG